MKRLYYKIIDGKTVFYNGEIIIIGDVQIINPTEEQLLEAGWLVWEEPQPTPEELLREAKDNKRNEIDNYDNSDSVNGIIVNGVQLWIPADKRAILKASVDAYKTLGIDPITKVWEGVEYTASADDWLRMIATVEVYASECYNVTARHKAAVEAMTTVEDVNAFDVTVGYPAMPEFNV